MKNLLIGAALGAAAFYLFKRSQDEGGLDKMCDEMKDYAGKVKRNVKDTWDKGVNQAEYVKERAEDKMHTVQAKVKEAMK
ncbi:hypothetical protein [Bacteroides sp. 519]|uniref:hypothetical protein n=1 Tax=Bacteroides sp. 519 TaxID=2302937 RepID=UPI0013D1974D|nr:hypothetical protein [Bacteroides sp. 519]NDV60069.1 hypothetical protein [Bacteroides sp. 519]